MTSFFNDFHVVENMISSFNDFHEAELMIFSFYFFLFSYKSLNSLLGYCQIIIPWIFSDYHL